jgi:imidazole glycerol-phosphate synthase subunit HisH
MIGIIDYGMGNISSVQRSLHQLGAETLLSADPEELQSCDRLILPGVGHFTKAMQSLESRDLLGWLRQVAKLQEKPILGICLGMQLMCRQSEEGGVLGLGWMDADVVKIRPEDSLRHKVPHIGWNNVEIHQSPEFFEGVDTQEGFYFVHSYQVSRAHPQEIWTTSCYESDFVSGLKKDRLYGVQFHPEKSHDNGAKFLEHFLRHA